MPHALLTGASRGIGLAIAKSLLESGYKVTGTSRTSAFSSGLTDSKRFHGIQADLGSDSEIQDILLPLIENGQPDILINNAGIFEPAGISVSDAEWLATWDRTIQVNLRSASLLCKRFIQVHRSAGSPGIIINIASRAAYRGDDQRYAAYAASKAGMVAFTKSIARDFGKDGILAYSVAPGFVETDMARETVKSAGLEKLTRDSAFDTLPQPEEVADLVLFLASGKAKQMTGSTFHINGGSYMI
ncbi:MAG: SDR family oxidoreductase [Balneolaceae bacterium]